MKSNGEKVKPETKLKESEDVAHAFKEHRSYYYITLTLMFQDNIITVLVY